MKSINNESLVRKTLANMIFLLAHCATRDKKEIEGLIGNVDMHVNNAFLFDIDLNDPMKIVFTINAHVIVIHETPLHQMGWMVETISTYIAYLMGDTNRKNDITKRVDGQVSNGIAKHISIAFRSNHSATITLATKSNTARIINIDFADLTNVKELKSCNQDGTQLTGSRSHI